MKKIISTLFALTLFCLHAFAQDATVTLQGIAFSPNVLTINQGETVQWNNMGGTHNVDGSLAEYPANPEGFQSNPTTLPAPWSFSHTFNIPGVYNYHCDAHETFGMTGTITVLPAAGTSIVITEIMYNNPGTDDYEFVEIYNNGNATVNLVGWALSNAVVFTFPSVNMLPGDYLVVSKDSILFEGAFGVAAFQWGVAGGALNNSGESIRLKNATGTVVDSVLYSSSAPWPSGANGLGSSLVLCNFSGNNNDPANWVAAQTPTGFIINGTEVLANPGAASACPAGPVVGFQFGQVTLNENSGNVFVNIIMTGGNANPTSVTVAATAASTATPGADHNVTTPVVLIFPGGVASDTQTITVNLVDDGTIEPIETLILEFTALNNSATVNGTGATFTLNILDNDTPLTNALVITSVFETPGNGVKGVELQAIENIPDLSIFGLGFVFNGNGASGQDFTLPAVSLAAGDCFYAANDSVSFNLWFGFDPDMVNNDNVLVNGDDAVEVYENSIIIDAFGDINVDGTGQPWEYTDGWAYRNSGTGPDGSVFNLANWSFSGIDVFDGAANNAGASIPLPVCTYSLVPPDHVVAVDDNATTDLDVAVDINVTNNDIKPLPLNSLGIVTFPANGTVEILNINTIRYTPNAGFCGSDVFTYEVCDNGGCDEATVFVTVECPSDYPEYPISVVTTVNATGQVDSLGVTCTLRGIVYGVDLQGNETIQFVFIDQSGGISLFSDNNFGYTVKEGDEVVVKGEISQFNCLAQITPDTLFKVSENNPLVTPEITAFLAEQFESELIQITNLNYVDIGEWLGTGVSFNVNVTNGASTYVMRIDNDTELSSMPPPQSPFHAIGLGGQFDNQGACDVGYQFLPRYAADIIPLDAVDESLLSDKIQVYPNPFGERLFFKSEVKIDKVTMSNLLGQQVLLLQNPSNEISFGALAKGMYLLTFEAEGATWTTKVVKE